jgi:purine-nucleoside phosphorylase
MNWFYVNDNTLPIISAKKHVNSSHGNCNIEKLPDTCVIFEIGMALHHIESTYKTKTLIEKLPCFLENPKCIVIDGYDNVCFTRGGYGAPAAVDTLETIHALGVKKVVVIGMCGVFSNQVDVGDVIIPHKILSEEGTSHHYFANHKYSEPNKQLFENAVEFFKDEFNTLTDAIVTSDAVYRQTFLKEALWREEDCVAVDMESSALLAVSKYYDIPAVSILLASDKHPISDKDVDWSWGNNDFEMIRSKFVDKCVTFSLEK